MYIRMHIRTYIRTYACMGEVDTPVVYLPQPTRPSPWETVPHVNKHKCTSAKPAHTLCTLRTYIYIHVCA